MSGCEIRNRKLLRNWPNSRMMPPWHPTFMFRIGYAIRLAPASPRPPAEGVII